MNNFRDAFFRFHFAQIWFCGLVIYVGLVNPTEAGRDNVVLWICLGLVGITGLIGDCLRRLELLHKRLKALEANSEERP